MASLAALSPTMTAMSMGEEIKTAQDMQDYLRSLHKVNEPSVDRIVIGDPLTRIRKAGTCWQPYLKTLKQASEMGINLMIVHEPTFYTHWDLDPENGLFQNTPSPARKKYLDAIQEKKRWIEENEMVIIRSHDVVRTWTQTTYAEDSGDPLVVINHGTSEEVGMRILNQHLNQGCTYRWIPGT